jgi:hypothetical protein
MVILGASHILWPGLPAPITSALYAQGALFELAFGLWLVIRAGDVSKRASVALADAAS